MARIVDISQTIYDGLRTNSSKPGEETRITFDIDPEFDDEGHTVRRINARLHSGTHIDAPEHMMRGGKSLDQYPIETFMGNALVVDMTNKVPGGEISELDLENAIGNKIRTDDILILRTGWSKHFPDEDYFRNSPFMSINSAIWCIEKHVRMVVVDFHVGKQGEEGPGAKDKLLEAGILNMTNVDNLDQVKKENVTLIAFPLKIAPCEAAPTRAVVIEED